MGTQTQLDFAAAGSFLAGEDRFQRVNHERLAEMRGCPSTALRVNAAPRTMRCRASRSAEDLKDSRKLQNARSGKRTMRRESLEAHERVKQSKERVRAEVLEWIAKQGPHGATADEVAVAMRCDLNHSSPRITELRRDGLLVATARRRVTRARCTAAVLVAREFEGRGCACPDCVLES